MDASDLQPAETIRAEINALQIHCAEGYDNCRWVGSVADEGTHRNGPYCAVQRIDCPFCDVKGLLVGAEYEAHKEVCLECVVICPQCCEDMPRRLLASHVRECTAEAIEPLRRQMENLSRPASPARFTATEEVLAAAKNCETPLQRHHAGGAEPIERDDDDVDQSAAMSPPPVAPSFLDVTKRDCDTTALPPPAPTQPLGDASVLMEEEFSPAPERVCLSNNKDAAGNPSTDAIKLPCPMAAMGCDQRHTMEELTSPSVMQHHLCVVTAAYCSLMSAHGQLQSKCDGLVVAVEQQKKSIKMLDVRSALQSGKLNIPPATRPPIGAASAAGLVESPRVPTTTSAQTKPPAKGETEAEVAEESPAVTTPRPKETAAATAATPQRDVGVAGNSSKKRSVSSPAAPDRTSVVDGKTSAAPMFVPSMPKKKAPTPGSGATGSGAPPRRPVAAAAAAAPADAKAKAMPAAAASS